jgi:hypothetical protein
VVALRAGLAGGRRTAVAIIQQLGRAARRSDMLPT